MAYAVTADCFRHVIQLGSKSYLVNGLRPVRVDRGIKLLAVSPIGERCRTRTDG